ncbi:MAG: FimV/HubP family polar landmark protein [Wenzhouxiangella sp.]
MRLLTTKTMVLGLAAGLLLALPMGPLQALGLGEARVDSYLGQPLDLRIRLVEADQRALESLTVMPASVRDHERLGVPSDSLALGLDLSVDRRVDPPVLRVRTRRPVNEPVIQFLVDARWSGGRVLREYTLFLDPPTLDIAPPVQVRRDTPAPAEQPSPARETPPVARPAPAQPASPAARPAEPPRGEPTTTAPPASESAVQPEAPAATAAQPEPRAPEPASRPSATTVAAGQTLWSIAYAWRPDTNLSMNQVMLAIRDRNPQAFVDGNVNQLMRGAILEMPGLDEVRALDAREADRRMAAQMQAWQRSPRAAEVPVITEAAVPEVLTERPSDRPAEPPVETVHRLEVVPPEGDLVDDGSAAAQADVERANARLDELEDQLLADDGADRAFWSDISRIRDAIESREAAGLAVADEEMALLETRLRESRLAREAAAAEALVAEQAVEEDEVSAYFRDLESELIADADQAAADQVMPAAGEEPVVGETVADGQGETEAPAVPAAPVAERSGGLPVWVWAVLAFVILLVLILVVLLKRRGSDGGTSRSAAVASDVPALRERVAAEPASLAAHLALLQALAQRDGAVGFEDALDDMYANVSDESADEWQSALALAAEHAPHHPLLMPPETEIREGTREDDGLDDQTREMLGLLDQDASSASGEHALDDEDDVEDDEPSEEDIRRDEATLEPVDQEDADLAVLADRLDPDPSGVDADSFDEAADDEDDLIFSLDEDAPVVPPPVESPEADQDSDATDVAAEPASDLDLDFSFSSQIESVPGEAAEEDVLPFEDDLVAVDDDQRSDLAADGEPSTDETGSAEDELEAFLRAEESDEPLDDLVASADEDLAPSTAVDSDTPADDGLADEEPVGDGDGSLSDDDAEVKLDLARAYLAMEDPDSARTLLEEIDAGASASMRAEARRLLKDL